MSLCAINDSSMYVYIVAKLAQATSYAKLIEYRC